MRLALRPSLEARVIDVDSPLHAPTNAHPIRKLYAVMSIDPLGNNGICGTIIPGAGAFPLIFGHEDKLHFLQDQAVQLQKIAPPGVRIALFEFSDKKEFPR